jgi:hypothetical protein
LAEAGATQGKLAPVKGKTLVCGTDPTPIHEHDKDQHE